MSDCFDNGLEAPAAAVEATVGARRERGSEIDRERGSEIDRERGRERGRERERERELMRPASNYSSAVCSVLLLRRSTGR